MDPMDRKQKMHFLIQKYPDFTFCEHQIAKKTSVMVRGGVTSRWIPKILPQQIRIDKFGGFKYGFFFFNPDVWGR